MQRKEFYNIYLLLLFLIFNFLKRLKIMKKVCFSLLFFLFIINGNSQIITNTDTIIRENNYCEFNGKNISSSATYYQGNCQGNQANGFGTLQFENGTLMKGYFTNNNIQDLYLDYLFPKEKLVVIGPNQGFLLHGPCMSIRNNNMVTLENFSNGKWFSNRMDSYTIPSPSEQVEDILAINNEITNEGGINIPNTNSVLLISCKKPNKKHGKDYNVFWITQYDIDKNKVINQFGNYDNPISYSGVPEFVTFDSLNKIAYFKFIDENKSTKYVKCNLYNGQKSLINTVVKPITESIRFEQKLYNSNFENYHAIGRIYFNSDLKNKYILMKDSSYVKIYSKYNQFMFASDTSYGSIIVRYSKKHEILQKRILPNINVYDYCIDEKSSRIGITSRDKVHVYLEYYNLSNFLKLSTVFAKKTDDENPIYFGKVSFSKNGIYLFYQTGSSETFGTTIFLNDNIYYGVAGEILSESESDNVIITKINENILAFDIEKKRIIWRYDLGLGSISVFTNSNSNNLNIIKLNTKSDKFYFLKFKLPNPIINLNYFVQKADLNSTINQEIEEIKINDLEKNADNTKNLIKPNKTVYEQKKMSTEIKYQYNKTSVTTCKWCKKRFNCEKNSNEVIELAKSFSAEIYKMALQNRNSDEVMSKNLNDAKKMYGVENNPEIDNFVMNKIDKYLKEMLVINIYNCPEFCSLKCETEFNYYKNQ
jgi:hypothetical protein